MLVDHGVRGVSSAKKKENNARSFSNTWILWSSLMSVCANFQGVIVVDILQGPGNPAH